MSKVISFAFFVVTLISCLSEVTQSTPIIKGPKDLYPMLSSEETILLECQVNQTAELSSVIWSKTFARSTELIYLYDGSEGSIIPEPPSNSTWKYRVLETNEHQGNFTLEIGSIAFTDVGTYECRVESDGVNYTREAEVSVYGQPKITQTPEEIPDNHVYVIECSIETALASIDSGDNFPNIRKVESIPLHEPISESPSTWVDLEDLEAFEKKPVVWYRNFTMRASIQDQREVSCSGYIRWGGRTFEIKEEVQITRNPVITKGPDNRFPITRQSATILECQVNETADISLVIWSKTLLGSTELIYTYDGNEGTIIPPPPSNSTWKYRVLESYEQDRNFTLEIANITLSDVGTYECIVESNGQNYTEQANVSVYGNLRVTQIPATAVQGGYTYDFRCSAEVALVDNSSELMTSAKPSIAAWRREYLSSDPTRVNSRGSEWTGLDPFGDDLPVYNEDYMYWERVDYDNLHYMGCTFTTPERNFDVYRQTSVGIPAENVQLTSGSRFYPGDTITCRASGLPSISSYQWFEKRQPNVLRVEGQVLKLNDSDVGRNTWICRATNYINGKAYTDDREKSFTVVEINGGTRPASGASVLLLTFSVLYFGV